MALGGGTASNPGDPTLTLALTLGAVKRRHPTHRRDAHAVVEHGALVRVRVRVRVRARVRVRG